MKKIYILGILGATLISSSSVAQGANNQEIKKEQCKWFMKTQPLRDLMEQLEVDPNELNKDGKKRRDTDDWSEVNDIGIPENNGIDPALQSEDGWRDGSGMMRVNFDGPSGSNPPDPSGAAGIDHYFFAKNTSYKIYNKDGSSAGPTWSLSNMWPGSSNLGDPIVMYDRYADRWFLSQFQPNNDILIAISETSDPLGSYYLYSFGNSQFPDYPKYGVWSNAYLMTANTSGQDVVVYEREKMLLGDPTASQIKMYSPSMASGGGFFALSPVYAEGLWAPEPDEPSWFFVPQDNAWSGASTDHMKVIKVVIDWDTPSNTTIETHQEIPVTAWNLVFTSFWDDITQPSSQKLDGVPKIFMNRTQYRRFPGYDVVMLCTTVDVNNNNRAGIRWFEMRKDDGSDQWYIHQESTYDPDDGNSRWMGSIGMDLNGNIGLAYNIAGPAEYPGIRYTARFSDDPLNTMTVQEQTAIDGENSKEGDNRWGDYAQMTLDPTDDGSFWYTGCYMGTSSFTMRTRIFSFKMWELLGEEEKQASAPYFNAYQPNPYELGILWNDLKDDRFDAAIYDMGGKLIAQESNIDATLGKKVFNVPQGSTGIYIVKLTGENTNLSEKIFLGK